MKRTAKSMCVSSWRLLAASRDDPGLLKLSRAGKVIGEFTMVDLQELTAVIKADLGELLQQERRASIKSPLPHVWGDHNRLAQLLANLIANAVKYNQSSRPWVEVEATMDTGPTRRIMLKKAKSILRLSLRLKTTESASNPNITKQFFNCSGDSIPTMSMRAQVSV